MQAPQTALVGDTLFEVKDKSGQTVFGVYEEGVRIYVMPGAKGSKSGFTVGGRTGGKASNQDFLVVTNDSIRIYLDSTSNVRVHGVVLQSVDATIRKDQDRNIFLFRAKKQQIQLIQVSLEFYGTQTKRLFLQVAFWWRVLTV